jgi:hypothetical protein
MGVEVFAGDFARYLRKQLGLAIRLRDFMTSATKQRSKPCADVEEPSALDSKKLKRLGEVGV